MGKKLIYLFCFVLLFSLVSAVPPVTTVQQFNEGYAFSEINHQEMKLGEDFTYFFFLFNQSTGIQITTNDTNCSFYMTDSRSNLLIFGESVLQPNGYWYYNISGDYFDEVGYYYYGVSYQNGFGGALDGVFEITYTGFGLDTSQAILYGFFLTLLVLIFLASIVGMGFLPAKNSRDEEGRILSINYLKYFRNVLMMVAYFLFIGINYIVSNIAYAFLNEKLIADTFFMIFRVSFGLAPLVVIVWMIWIFVSMFHDKQFQKMLNRGMFPGGTI